MIIRNYLNNVLVYPLNRDDFAIVEKFTEQIIVEDTDINEVVFGLGEQDKGDDGVKIIKGWQNLLEPIPYRVEIESNGVTNVVFNGFINAAEATYQDERIVAKVFRNEGVEELQRLAQGTSFEYLEYKGSIKESDYIAMPYVVRKVPFALDFYLVSFSIFVMTFLLIDQINELVDIGIEVGGVFTTAAAIGKLIPRIAFIVTLLTSLIINTIAILNYIIQPVKYHTVMRVITQLQKAAQAVGYTFNSSILEGTYKDMCILPEKQRISFNDIEELLGNLTTNNANQQGFYKGTVWQLIEAMLLMFNARLFINVATKNIRLERRDYLPSAPQYKLSGVEYEEFNYNIQEFYRDFALSFQVDVNDKNTIQQYDGTAMQVIYEPVGVINPDLWRQQPIRSVTIPFALAKVKMEFYAIERLVNGFLGVLFGGIIAQINALISGIYLTFQGVISLYNAVISVINFFLPEDNEIPTVTPPPPPQISPPLDLSLKERISVIEMSEDDVQIPKLFIINEHPTDATKNKVSPANGIVLTADYIYDQFYKIDSFVGTQNDPIGNQYKLFNIEKDIFTVEDYNKTKGNQYIYDENGDICEVEQIRWLPASETVTIDFRKKYRYFNNLEEVKLLIDGK